MMISIVEIKKAILALSKKNTVNKLFEEFLDSFFSYIPFDDLNKKHVQELHKIAEVSYNFFKRKTEDQSVYIIANSTPEFELQKGEAVIIILNNDMPFLVDSITECFNRQKYRIHTILNSTFCVSRNTEGRLQSIDNKSKNANESLIYIKLSNITSCINIDELKMQCESVFKNVSAAVSDWNKMSETLQKCISNFTDNDKDETKESKLFLEWILNGNFIFVGNKSYLVKEGSVKATGDNQGICKLGNKCLDVSIKEDVLHSNDFHIVCNKVFIGKIREVSQVHRAHNLDYVCIAMPQQNGDIKAIVFIGLFVSRLDHQSVSTIPLIQKKVRSVIDRSKFLENSFNAKELLSILEAFPKRDLFQISAEELFNMAITILSCITHPRLVLFIRGDACKRFVDVNILFPRKRVESDILEKVQATVSKYIPGQIVDSNLNFFSIGLASINISIVIEELFYNNFDKKDVLEASLDKLTSNWSENLGVSIEEYFGAKKADLINKYSRAFSASYALKFSLDDAVSDIDSIEDMLSKNDKVLFKLHIHPSDKTTCCFRIYSLEQKVDLHQIMPLFNNLGFYAIAEDLFEVFLSTNKVCIQYFVLRVDPKDLENLKANKNKIEEAIKAIFYNTAKNDVTNQLIPKAGLTWREVFLLNAYCQYLLQIKFLYSQDFIKTTLVKYPELAKLLIKLFYCYFDHSSLAENSISIENKIKAELLAIKSTAEDRVIRKFLELIHATLRTNYFQAESGLYKDYVSLKIDSAKVSDIPLPKPFAEIFVYSLYMEGIHLRGGKISRGGIRWSDRIEDYRTEVLGLMKSQMTKNTIIVPDGSKGGYIIKSGTSDLTREEIFLESIKCYKVFLRGMLDITDNMKLGVVQKPKQVICRDGEDPYLVVAADKGTATFSDIANDVASKEYNFWLGDAFASGGGAGYDHKEMGITAKGAWISVEHHFNSFGLDPQKDTFTVVGIGDMAGDVFGNGMLLSDKIKLVAAFNHMHIFVDPDPESKISYKERQRLFCLAGSTWDDYNRKLISRGGGVFERKAKSIPVSTEIKNLLCLTQDVIEPETLIKAILTAKVDLIWNGGIGTYVKSQNEVHEQIGNKSNDDVRVDAIELKCKVFAEGGNLGCTQLGRVEFAFNGGNINTDFIDNSAGVDCSDHEVNIKIVLDQAVLKKKITNSERNDLLVQMKSEVADLVLYDNKIQNQNISIDKSDNVNDLYSCIKLIGFLEHTAGLNPQIEFLPSKNELTRRKQGNLGLSRPELAILMAYSKRSLYNSIVSSKVTDEKFYQKYLFEYFPSQIIKSFSKEIQNHPLKKEIIATCATNDFINHLGINFYQSACEFTGISGCDIIRAFSVAWNIFDLKELWNEISMIKDFYLKIDMYTKLRAFAKKVIFWLLKNHKHPVDVEAIIGLYKKHIIEIRDNIDSYVSQDLKCEYNLRLQALKVKKIPELLALKIARLDHLYYVLDVLLIFANKKYNFTEMLMLYFEVGEKFYYNWLQGRVETLPVHNYWDRMLIKSIKDDIDLQHRQLVNDMVKTKSRNVEEVINKWKESNSKKVEMFSMFIKSVMTLEELDYSKLIIAVKQGDILLG